MYEQQLDSSGSFQDDPSHTYTFKHTHLHTKIYASKSIQYRIAKFVIDKHFSLFRRRFLSFCHEEDREELIFRTLLVTKIYVF